MGFAPAPVMTQEGKENIESGTQDYRIIRYTRPNAFTCSAMICERRDSFQCGVRDGMVTISKRSEEDVVYLSYYPAKPEGNADYETRIQIGPFDARAFTPIPDYPETWIVPDIPTNEDMMFELEREARRGDIEIRVRTEAFARKIIWMRDLEGMKRDVLRLCPTAIN